MRIIAGTARGTVIDAPQGRDTRPTLDRVRENVFNILQQQVRGARVLDLFSGSGAMAFEAVSRGAASAVLVDVDKKAHQVEEANCRKLRMDDRCRLLLMQGIQFVFCGGDALREVVQRIIQTDNVAQRVVAQGHRVLSLPLQKCLILRAESIEPQG